MGFEAPRRLVRALGESDDWLGLLPALTDEAVSREGLDVERVMAPGAGAVWSSSYAWRTAPRPR